MSKLDAYIQTLLSDNHALEQFIKDPLVSESPEFGLTKAERSVLRRVVIHLPPTAKSGFSGARSISSFRRSLRLIQNVLHYSSTAVHAKMLSAPSSVEAMVDKNFLGATADVNVEGLPSASSQNGGTFYLYVYYPNGGSNNYTGKTNAFVNQKGGPYTNYQFFQIVFGDGPTTVERLLLGASQAFPNSISYQTVNGTGGLPYVSEITINGNMITADLSHYQLSDDFVFWFYSVNGKPNQGGTSGIEAESFRNFPLNSGDTVFWQLIAPDADYGFQTCITEAPMTFTTA
jgi:hypothetical protein